MLVIAAKGQSSTPRFRSAKSSDPSRASASNAPVDRVSLPNDRRVAARAGGAEPAPTRPEEKRDEEADDPDHHQDDADGVDVEAAYGRIDAPCEHCAGGREQ